MHPAPFSRPDITPPLMMQPGPFSRPNIMFVRLIPWTMMPKQVPFSRPCTTPVHHSFILQCSVTLSSKRVPCQGAPQGHPLQPRFPDTDICPQRSHALHTTGIVLLSAMCHHLMLPLCRVLPHDNLWPRLSLAPYPNGQSSTPRVHSPEEPLLPT